MVVKDTSPAAWTDEHTLHVLRGIISSTLASRPALYALPELKPVSNNRGDRINKKLQQLLRKLEDAVPGAAGMVAQEVGKLGKRGSASPKKVKAAGAGAGGVVREQVASPGAGRKRKRAEVKEEEADEDLEEEE
ncbi:hypothetical protein JCM24511_01598 [Saitozyma sp. JCM 24511]|nr:hypothetical protein JCM24511_01598 [Saitozyma sp. JCM 24511]